VASRLAELVRFEPEPKFQEEKYAKTVSHHDFSSHIFSLKLPSFVISQAQMLANLFGQTT